MELRIRSLGFLYYWDLQGQPAGLLTMDATEQVIAPHCFLRVSVCPLIMGLDKVLYANTSSG